MSIVDQCQKYRSTSDIYWKTSLGEIIEALKREGHQDEAIFSNVAWTLMMHDKPGYLTWLNRMIDRLISDPKARLEPPIDLQDYGEMSDADLVEKYLTNNDENYPREELIRELKYRHPSLDLTDPVNLRNTFQ